MGNIRNWEKLYEVKGPKSLLDMSAVELAERQKECDTIVLSFGAIENHSSHLPLGADWFQGNALIKCVAEELEAMGHKAIPGFCVPFGVQTNRFERLHLHGNCYISQMTFITLVEEICLSLHESGFRRFILCINHSEDEAALHVAAKDLADNYDIKSIVADWVPPMNDFWPKVLKNKDHQGHGGEDETACVMAVVPELVNTEARSSITRPRESRSRWTACTIMAEQSAFICPFIKITARVTSATPLTRSPKRDLSASKLMRNG